MLSLRVAVILLLTLGACATVNDQTVPDMSTGQLCDFLGPAWITTPGERAAVLRELEKRQARCAGGMVVDYGVGNQNEGSANEPKGPSSGSVFFVNSKGVVATNSHVVKTCSKLQVVVNGRFRSAGIIAVDHANDVALLSTDAAPAEFATLEASKQPSLADRVLVLGYPLRGILADQLNATSGDITSLAGLEGDSRYFQMSAPVQPGNSGGPVFNESGKVVGIATATIDAVQMANVTGSIPQNVNFGLRVMFLKNMLDVNGLPYSTSDERQALSAGEIAELALDFVVPVVCG